MPEQIIQKRLYYLEYAPPSYKDAIAGDGATGWDWVIWSFEQARKGIPECQIAPQRVWDHQ
jgi:hypothetical protein